MFALPTTAHLAPSRYIHWILWPLKTKISTNQYCFDVPMQYILRIYTLAIFINFTNLLADLTFVCRSRIKNGTLICSIAVTFFLKLRGQDGRNSDRVRDSFRFK